MTVLYVASSAIPRYLSQSKNLSWRLATFKCFSLLTRYLLISLIALQTDLEAVKDDVESIQQRVKQLRYTVAKVKESNQNIEGMAKALVKHFNIPWDKDDDDDEKN